MRTQAKHIKDGPPTRPPAIIAKAIAAIATMGDAHTISCFCIGLRRCAFVNFPRATRNDRDRQERNQPINISNYVLQELLP